MPKEDKKYEKLEKEVKALRKEVDALKKGGSVPVTVMEGVLRPAGDGWMDPIVYLRTATE